ncbi:uncharacterized [Tachysurus ichikawai]
MPVSRAALELRQSRQKPRSRTVPVLRGVLGGFCVLPLQTHHIPMNPAQFRHIKLRRWMRAMRSGLRALTKLINKPAALTNPKLPSRFMYNRRIVFPINVRKVD